MMRPVRRLHLVHKPHDRLLIRHSSVGHSHGRRATVVLEVNSRGLVFYFGNEAVSLSGAVFI